ncbi:MAG: hemerythrin domain-containing protein [Thermoplasmatales archaeon]|jgi:hemerythrin superfamily protein|nr:hemerythrin domain-containing protein [Thermoplasmatales archaeon]
MKTNSIIGLMLKDHEKIVDYLNKVEEGGHPDIEAFLKFEWHLKKHIFIEEKAIFISYQPSDDSEEEKIFNKLSKEHTVIMDLLDKILKESFPRGNTSFNKLKKLLAVHKKFEENEVYPKLEEKLNEKNKREIIKKITEII